MKTKKIMIEWEENEETLEADLPMTVQIPADMPDEDVVPYLISNYGYDVYAWSEVD